jgi:hypothetical protein
MGIDAFGSDSISSELITIATVVLGSNTYDRLYINWSRVIMKFLYLPSVHFRAALPHIIIGSEVMMNTQLKAPISHMTSVTDCASNQLPVAKVKIIPRVLLTTATPTIPSNLETC